MTKRFLRKHAHECAVHKAVATVMHDRLILEGSCSKEAALDEAGYTYCENYVRWDYIKEMVEARLKEEVIPVASRFWKMTEDKRREHPERALASGYGKKTAGFALVSWSPEIARKYLQHKEKVRKGITKGANKTAQTLQKHDVPLVEDGSKLRDTDDVQDLINPDQRTLALPA